MTHYLPIGHTIQDHDHSGEYTIKSVLGRGASTIAYLADYSDRSGYTSERILKEYYPISLDIARDSSGELIYAGSVTEKFIEGLAHYKAVELSKMICERERVSKTKHHHCNAYSTRITPVILM